MHKYIFSKLLIIKDCSFKNNFDHYNFAGSRKQLIRPLKLFDIRVRVGESKMGYMQVNFKSSQLTIG